MSKTYKPLPDSGSFLGEVVFIKEEDNTVKLYQWQGQQWVWIRCDDE